MSNRYYEPITILNNSQLYKEIFDSKGIKKIECYTVTDLFSIKDSDYFIVYHKVSPRDRLSNLAHLFYGDSSKWWIIAQINNIKSDFDLVPNTEIKIAFPPSELVKKLAR